MVGVQNVDWERCSRNHACVDSCDDGGIGLISEEIENSVRECKVGVVSFDSGAAVGVSDNEGSVD